VCFPIVASARSHEWIERLLPGGVGLHADVLAVRGAKMAQRLDEFLPFRGVAGVEDSNANDLLSVNFLRKDRESDPAKSMIRLAARLWRPGSAALLTLSESIPTP